MKKLKLKNIIKTRYKKGNFNYKKQLKVMFVVALENPSLNNQRRATGYSVLISFNPGLSTEYTTPSSVLAIHTFMFFLHLQFLPFSPYL